MSDRIGKDFNWLSYGQFLPPRFPLNLYFLSLCLCLSLPLSPLTFSPICNFILFFWITSFCFYLVSKISGVFTLLTITKDIMYCHLPLLLFVCFKYCTMKPSIFEMTTIFSKKNLFSFHMVWMNREAVCFLPQGHGPFKEAGMVQVIRETPYVLL